MTKTWGQTAHFSGEVPCGQWTPEPVPPLSPTPTLVFASRQCLEAALRLGGRTSQWVPQYSLQISVKWTCAHGSRKTTSLWVILYAWTFFYILRETTNSASTQLWWETTPPTSKETTGRTNVIPAPMPRGPLFFSQHQRDAKQGERTFVSLSFPIWKDMHLSKEDK